MTLSSFDHYLRLTVICLVSVLLSSCSFTPREARVLVFSKTAGFRHNSIPAGITAIQQLGTKHQFVVDTTEDARNFNEKNLQRYNAIVFLNTTADVLNQEQQNDFERFIQAGGGFVGIHAATDTEYDWPWYNKLVGAWFESHPNNPNVRKGTFRVLNTNHIATDSLPIEWEREDEFYNFKDINPEINVLIDIDEKSYEGGTNGDNHPMAWYHEYDGGRAFYTAMGHTPETFSDPLFLTHLMGGIKYALGGDKLNRLNYKKAYTPRVPEENRFTKVVLAERLDEPMQLAVLPDERVLFIERLGKVRLYDPTTLLITDINTIPVSHVYLNQDGNQPEAEDGLLGLALDPNFEKNSWVYLYYSPLGDKPVNILARYEFDGEKLVEASKKTVLEVDVQRDYCCHTGGGIGFDADGNLYLSTGDNTSPRATAYAPIDEREGRGPWDAQKSSANPNDLRGKILRIHPEDDGTYTVPKGNLFPEGTEGTRPEIYTMGLRNPYRIYVDKQTGNVYWGDVGPDAGRDSTGLGPRGYDEFNVAQAPGFFGWPYFTGNNAIYGDYDFTNNKLNGSFDPVKPKNDSPNNTGIQDLPPAQPAMIWYPAARSEEFSQLGTGGRSAMSGPVYHKSEFKGAERPFPDYFDGKWFIFEWMRGWIIAVTMDEEGNYERMERFMPSYTFNNPVHMAFSHTGDLYMLEYGTRWFAANENARLIKIEYNDGNRKPVLKLAADKPKGAIPHTVQFSSDGTKDYDRDDLSYSWTLYSPDQQAVATYKEANPTHTFDQAGVYRAALTVSDQQGASSTADLEIIAGNEPPSLEIEVVGGNKSFYFPGKAFEYAVKVVDQEDGSLANGDIANDEVALNIDYLAEGFDQIAIAQGHRISDLLTTFAKGRKLINENVCKSCHTIGQTSIGPAYQEVAKKYGSDDATVDMLTKKVMEGGNGVWGEAMMPANPQLKVEDAKEMIRYILGLDEKKVPTNSLPLQGTYSPKVAASNNNQGVFIIRAAYKDKGANGVPGAESEEVFVLRNPRISPTNSDKEQDIQRFSFGNRDILIASKSGSYLGYNQIDLTGITSIAFGVSVNPRFSKGGKIEIRIDAPNGPKIGETPDIAPQAGRGFRGGGSQEEVTIVPTDGAHDIYVVFESNNPGPQSIMVLSTIEFKAEASLAASRF